MTDAALAAARHLADNPWHTDNEVGHTIRALVDEIVLLRTKLAVARSHNEPAPIVIEAEEPA